jgi:dihydroflavonol-4-reductase
LSNGAELGHVLAASAGRVGEWYLLGDRNLSVDEHFRMIAEAAGVAPPRYEAPYVAALGVAHWYEFISRFTNRHPVATVSELKIGGR